MTGLALQIDGKWAVLGDGDSVNIENNSPVWGEGNSFSLPFELDIEANRHILGNADQITGESVYKVLDGKRAVLYTLGIPVYYGKIKMDDEVELSDGKVDVTLVSGNLTFDEMIEGMNCQDVELLDEIIVGERVSEWTLTLIGDTAADGASVSSYFPNSFMWMEADGVSTVNVTHPYPAAKYCNMRVCYQIPEPNGEGEDLDFGSLTSAQKTDFAKSIEKVYDKEKYGKYVVLEADRSLSGLCFYVMYFLDCLFKGKLKMAYSNEAITYMEDMNRLAFCSTRCSYDEKDSGKNAHPTDYISKKMDYQVFWNYSGIKEGYRYTWDVPLKYCVANSKNFPDIEVSELIEALRSGFGIRFLFDDNFTSCKCVFIRDVLKDTEVKIVNATEIYEVDKLESNIKGFELKYSSDDDDTAYNYQDWGKNVETSDSYNYIVGKTDAYNKTLYIDTRNGNAYRVKVDENAKNEDELNASLFEVGTYSSATYGDCSNEDNVESVEIGFTPVIMNDVFYKKKRSVLRSANRKSSRATSTVDDTSSNDQLFALFMDISMKYPSWVPYINVGFAAGRYTMEFKYTYFESQRYDESRTDQSKKAYNEAKTNRKSVGSYIKASQFENESPIQTLDTGLMLGLMRGPGNEDGFEDYDENYDSEGNFKYVMTSKGHTFHADTVDNYSRTWDYNGKEEGGVSQEGRFSLKLRAEKPNPEGGFYPLTDTYAQRRGLFDKFYSEYAYFVVNRKIVRITCRMGMADLLNIDWTKRYKIGEYVGFINKYSYSVSSSGISDVELEMYYI